jgi:hypothetical protein
VPHTAADLQPGVSVRVGGAKARLHVATHDRETPAARMQLHAVLQRLFDAPVDMLRHYLEITLTPGNPIMHSAVICGLIGPQGPYHGRPLPRPLDWWTEYSDQGAELLERLDAENQRLCRAVEARLGIDLSSVKPLKQEIVEAYGEQIADTRTMAVTAGSSTCAAAPSRKTWPSASPPWPNWAGAWACRCRTSTRPWPGAVPTWAACADRPPTTSRPPGPACRASPPEHETTQ